MPTDATRVARPRLREGLALVLVSLAAILFQRAATMPWVKAEAGDGARIEVSPIGLRHLAPGDGTPTECRWWPRLGAADLCEAPSGGLKAMRTLRRAYPLTIVALWTGVLALFLNALRVPRGRPGLRVLVAATVPSLGAVALWILATMPPRALAVLGGAAVSPLAPGFVIVAAAIGLSAVASMLFFLARADAA